MSNIDGSPSNEDVLESSRYFTLLDLQAYEEDKKNGADDDDWLSEENSMSFKEAIRHLQKYNQSWKKIRKL